jgi:hypothetical protein
MELSTEEKARLKAEEIYRSKVKEEINVEKENERHLKNLIIFLFVAGTVGYMVYFDVKLPPFLVKLVN